MGFIDRPTVKSVSPISKYLEWKSNEKCFSYYDKEKNSVVGFKKSELSFKDYVWFNNENDQVNNKIVFDKELKNFDFQDFTLSHNNQKMNFYGKLQDSTYKDFNFTFKDVDINKITPEIDSLKFDGNLNGIVKYYQKNNTYKPESQIVIDSLKINNILLGDLSFNVKGNKSFNNFPNWPTEFSKKPNIGASFGESPQKMI